MNLREYQYVLKVAQLQNMTRAAEALYITQPSLSHYIARVEEELGVQLFNRLTTPLSLTPAGEKYVETAQMILELDSGLKKELSEIAKGKKGVITLGMSHARASFFLPYFTVERCVPGKHLLLKTAGSYEGSVTTDELIPSGEASSYRSNPEKISGYTMISRDPEYVGRAKEIRGLEEEQREMDGYTSNEQLNHLLDCLKERLGCLAEEITLGSLMVSDQIGDGSSREQAASCQRVLGGFANLANTYSTKRYRSNLINWGMLPLRTEETLRIPVGTYLLVPDVRKALEQGAEEIAVQVLNPRDGRAERVISCQLDHLTENERRILLAGCLMNYYRG